MSERPRPKPRPLGLTLPENQPRLMCPYCGHHRFQWGAWLGGHFQPDDDSAPIERLRARRCQGCGHVALFVQE